MMVANAEPIVVVCAADDNYAMPLAVTIRSALVHLATKRKITLFIIDGGIRESNKRKILKSVKSEQCEVRWLAKPDEQRFAENVLFNSHLTIAAYYRLFISELLPDQFKKVIYLDCDLVVKEDLSQLWDIEMGEHCLLGVQDYRAPYVSSPLGLINYRELDISPDCKYLNTGVLVINLQKWRTHNMTEKAIKYLQENKEYVRFADQDILNPLFQSNWGELDPRWNHQGIVDIKDQELLWKGSKFPEDIYNNLHENPYLIHYAYIKPWNTLDKSPRIDEFYKYVDMTAWSGWRYTFWHHNWHRFVGKVKRIRSEIYLKLQGTETHTT